MSVAMPHTIRLLKDDTDKSRTGFLYIRDSRIRTSPRIAFRRSDIHFLIHRLHFRQILHAAPLIDIAHLSIRIGITEQSPHRREQTIMADLTRRKLRLFRTPLRKPVNLRSCPHKHGCPVDRTGRRQYTSLLQRIRAIRHQLLDSRHLRLFHTISTPAVEADQHDMFGFPFCRTSDIHTQESTDNQQKESTLFHNQILF